MEERFFIHAEDLLKDLVHNLMVHADYHATQKACYYNVISGKH
jgi:hypothetical protein